MFYEVSAKSVNIYPHLGVSYELGKADKDDGRSTGRYRRRSVMGAGGVDFYYKMISLSSEIRLPVYYNIPE